MRWLTYFYDFSFKWIAKAAIGIHPTKTWLSQLVNFKNAIWHFRKMICNKILFKLGNDSTETYGMFQTAFRPSCMNRASVLAWHKRFREVRDSLRDDEWCERSKEVRTPELIGQEFGLGLGLLCWGLKGVQEAIHREEASTLQMRSLTFTLGQCTSPQLHACHRIFGQDGHQDSSSSSL